MNKKPKNIEQLYSESFNDFRLEPSSGLWKSISSKLAWRNFFSFTPTTLNAWYVAGLLTLATAGALWITKPVTDKNQETKEITINNERQKAEGGRQKEESSQQSAVDSPQMNEGNKQKAVGSWQLKEDSIQKPNSSIKNTATQHSASSSEVSTKVDSSTIVSSTAEASAKAVTKVDTHEPLTRIVSRSAAKVDNPPARRSGNEGGELVTPDLELATPHPTPTQQPALSSEVLTKEDTDLPEPWPNAMDSLFTDLNSTAPEHIILFPNAFTPNSNGPTNGYYTPGLPNNDVFHPEYKGVVEYHLSIFNRRGELIFECNDINIGWDGYINDRLAAQGVYVWKARGRYTNGQSFTKLGNVILIKK